MARVTGKLHYGPDVIGRVGRGEVPILNVGLVAVAFLKGWGQKTKEGSCSREPGEAHGAAAHASQGRLAGLCSHVSGEARRAVPQKQVPLLLLSEAPWKTGTRPPTPAPADLLRALGLSTSLFSYLKWEQGLLPPQPQRGSLWKSKGQSSHGLLFSPSRSHFYLPRPSPAMLPTATTQQRGRPPRTLTLEPDVEG